MTMRAKVAAGLVLGLTCGASAYWVHAWFDPTHSVELAPSTLELVREPVEGEPVNVPLQLFNRGSREITLREVRRSCSCTKIVTRGGQALDGPLTIPPGADLPCEVTINTAGRIGEQRFQVAFLLEANGRPFERHAFIQMSVLGGWRSDPYELVLPDLTPDAFFEAVVDLYDGHPEPGLPLSEVVSLNPERIRVRVEPVTSQFRDSTYPKPFQKRYQLVVFGEAPSEHGRLFHASIAVRSSRSEIPEFRIPVRGRTRDADYRLYPPSLEIETVQLGETYRRIVNCETRSAELPLPDSVIQKPSFLNVHISRVSETLARIEIEGGELSAKEIPAEPGNIVLGRDGTALVSLAVRLARSP